MTTIQLSQLKASHINAAGVNVTTRLGTRFFLTPALNCERHLGRFRAVNYTEFKDGWKTYKKIGDLRRDLEIR